MVKIGYKLTSEQHGPLELVRYAKYAEEAGFDFAAISDHFHPWINKQGQSPFVWCTIGGISQATKKLTLATGVTCPTIRIHPAIIAQAAATAATMLQGRFILGVGSGENLNEHILGDIWPSASVRIEMLGEAVDVIRTLWKGGMQDYEGRYYRVVNAQIHTLPEELPPIFVAASGVIATETAGRIGDGFITTGGERKKGLIDLFKSSGGEGKPCLSEISLCWAENDEEAIDTVYEYWPLIAIKGGLSWEIPTQTHFQQLAQFIDKEDIAKSTLCSADPQKHIDKIKGSIDAGFDHVCVHQIGPNQDDFIEFFKEEVLPEFQSG